MTSMDEESWTDWLCDMEPDDYSFINQSETNMDKGSSLQSQHGIATTPHDTFNNSLVAESNLEIRPSKLLKTSNSSKSSSCSPCSYVLSFDNTNPPPLKVEPAMKKKTKVVNHGVVVPVNPKNSEPRRAIQEGKKNGSLARSSHKTPDHIIAERMRREKISKQFIALSALIPGLKKVDKASVLGEAIEYLKQVKEQVKVLEEEQSKRKSVESVVFVEKSQLSAEDEGVSDTSSNSCNGNSEDPSSKVNMSLPEVEARVSEKKVLIRILCEKEKAVVANVFREIEKLHLSVIHSSSFCFGSSFLVITTIAQMEDEFNMSVKKLAKSLRVGLMQLIK